MTKVDSIVAAQLNHLLEVVNTHRDVRCKITRDTAHQQAREIVRKAYREARSLLHRNIQESRQQMQRSIASARAQHKTRERLRKQQSDRQFLDLAWQQIHNSLAARWQSSENRTLWIEMIFQQASRVLLNNAWRIEHPLDWPESEKSLLAAQVRERTGNPPDMQPAEDIRAGLRISSGGAWVDGSIEGLLADRLRIDSELLSLGRKVPASTQA